MSETPTSWIWADAASGGVKGARLDAAADVIEWVDQPGCACGNDVQRQRVGDFLESGPFETAPPDVLAELRAAVSSIDSAAHRR